MKPELAGEKGCIEIMRLFCYPLTLATCTCVTPVLLSDQHSGTENSGAEQEEDSVAPAPQCMPSLAYSLKHLGSLVGLH